MKTAFTLSGLITALSALPALAQDGGEIVGKPHDAGIGFQPAVSELAVRQQNLDHLILVIITLIVLFVTGLMVYAIVRFNRRANPTPRAFTHNTPLEIAWTIIPVFVLVLIGAFSLPVLFAQQEIPEGDITIKAIGNQWYWSYEYVDDEFTFDSYMIGQPATGGNYQLTPEVEAQLTEAGYTRDEFLLAVDQPLVVPVGKIIVVQVTAADVIHSWTVPAFGVKQDGVPGRLAELWFQADKEGTFFGQCSELCGKDHAYMPITVKVVSEEAYQEWLKGAIEEFAGTPRTERVALAD
ncbi:cytochrome c oxidase subunit II [Albibacillus kandeliae]|uniref:cytochrome c oxidase subunit II n=1 Tax=Albibacillus kandeliae TaxID=2174228 RepID=UPI000D68DF67|nr:cytochrome c oxidase subunit II [Albibacillus kandeliae]